MSPLARTVAIRILCVGLFLAAYVTVWRPVRDWASSHVMAPVLSQVDTPRARQFEIHGDPPRAVEINSASTSAPVATMATPTGLLFVIGSVFLLAVRPRRLYWVYLGAYQLCLGVLMLALLAVGVGWGSWGFTVFELLRTDIYRGTSLALPLVFLWLDMRRGRGKEASD